MAINKNHVNSLNVQRVLEVEGNKYRYFSLPQAIHTLNKYFPLELASVMAHKDVLGRLPFSLKIVLENLIRHEDGISVTLEDIKAVVKWLNNKTSSHEIALHPARVLMQDFTGVPAIADLAAMRNAIQTMGGDPNHINPLYPVDLVIDHSILVQTFGHSSAFQQNVQTEIQRNQERYKFLKWGQKAFKNFRVVPPGTGICHQVNLEYLAKVVWSDNPINNTNNNETASHPLLYPDTLVGTDSHTTMINGLGVLGWGVGGIEAEAAMLGQPISLILPEVIGFKLKGALKAGTTSTDLVLTITQMLREKGVVGKFVEFYGSGLTALSLAERATIANMAPEYGANCGLFPIDQETLNYLTLTGREPTLVKCVEAYAKAQGMWHEPNNPEPVFTDTLELDLSQVEPSVAGPKHPQNRVPLSKLKTVLAGTLSVAPSKEEGITPIPTSSLNSAYNTAQKDKDTSVNPKDGDIVIAAITSCTNTSNPSVMLAAGLLAKKAVEKGLTTKSWVKTSLAPGSKVVTRYLKMTGLLPYLEQLGFYLVGYGCTTCIGNSGPLNPPIAQAITANNLTVCSILSGNRNFEGRIHPLVKANWLASPPLVVAFALAGTINIDLNNEPLGIGKDGQPIYLKDIWPSSNAIKACRSSISANMFRKEYADVFMGDDNWQSITVTDKQTYDWDDKSTYIRMPPFFTNITPHPNTTQPIHKARILALLGDNITTDHISPAGTISPTSPAADYLKQAGVATEDFNTYGTRRGNHEVMIRGTLANIRIKNEMVPGVEGGFTRLANDKNVIPIYSAAMQYKEHNDPLVIIAGKAYGTGSSRDWAAKGVALLGVSAVIAETFERIHRSNLIGMGVLPLKFLEGMTRHDLSLSGNEYVSILGMENAMTPKMQLTLEITYPDNQVKTFPILCRIETAEEMAYYNHGGILNYVLRSILKKAN